MGYSTYRMPGTPLAVAAALLTCIATVVLLVLPFSATAVTTTAAIGTTGTEGVTFEPIHSRQSLLDTQGRSIVLPLLVPVIVGIFPLLIRGRRPAIVARLTSATLLTGFVVVAILSVGVYYLPSAVLMAFSGIVLARRPMVDGAA
jgi:hypothetical protein